MTDTSTWRGLPDVRIDTGAADLLAAGCEDAATAIREQVARRRSLTTRAMTDFEGRFSRVFEQNQRTADSDGAQIADALEDVARQVRHLLSIVPDENARRRAAREWQQRRDEDKSKITLGDVLGDESPPEGPTSPPPPTSVSATASQRDTPQPGSGGGGGGGTSSARPEELRSFATGVESANQALEGRSDRLRGAGADFTAGFDWGTGEPSGVDGSSVYAALRLYHQLNRQDRTWVDTVAGAFERAGSQAPGGAMVLSDAALVAALQAAGVSVSRQDIPATSPRLFGLARRRGTPTTRSTPRRATSWSPSPTWASPAAAPHWR